ncbi:MAG TPA: hypothetical protein VNB90_00775 [Cytophagaceae bacterium]|nr:hypothetical protein [Cytophagaceae bacterium]
MDSLQTLMDEILLGKQKLVEKNTKEQNPAQAYQRAEAFLEQIESNWSKIKLGYLLQQQPPQVIAFTEELANFFLDHVDLYFTQVNKNHTVKMGEMISKVNSKVYGLAVSKELKERIDRASQDNSWHGH